MSSGSKDRKMRAAPSPASNISVDDYLQRCFQAIDDLASNPYVNGTLPGPDEGSGQEDRDSIQESPIRNSSHKSQTSSRHESGQSLDASRNQPPKGPEPSSKSTKASVDHMQLPPAAPAKPESKSKGFKALMRPSWR